MWRLTPPTHDPLGAALERMSAALHRKRAREFHAARLPYAETDTWTPLGDAATLIAETLEGTPNGHDTRSATGDGSGEDHSRAT